MKVTLPIQRAPSRVCGDVLWAGTAALLAPCLCGLSYHLPASHKPCPDWIPSCSWDVPLAFISLCWFSGLNICCPLFFFPHQKLTHISSRALQCPAEADKLGSGYLDLRLLLTTSELSVLCTVTMPSPSRTSTWHGSPHIEGAGYPQVSVKTVVSVPC